MQFKLIDLDEQSIKRFVRRQVVVGFLVFVAVLGVLIAMEHFVILYSSTQIQSVEALGRIRTFSLRRYASPVVIVGVFSIFNYRRGVANYLNSKFEVSDRGVLPMNLNNEKLIPIHNIKKIQSIQSSTFRDDHGLLIKYYSVSLVLSRKWELFSNSLLIRLEPQKTAEQFIEQLRAKIPVTVKRNMW